MLFISHAGKDKHISFQFQWHNKCSPLIPGDESTIEVQLVRQKWITLYSRSETSSSAAKIFMLVFLSEAYKELLHNCHLAISMPISSQQSTSTVTSDPLDVYYRLGGAALASLLHNCYKATKSSTTSNKDVEANEISHSSGTQRYGEE